MANAIDNRNSFKQESRKKLFFSLNDLLAEQMEHISEVLNEFQNLSKIPISYICVAFKLLNQIMIIFQNKSIYKEFGNEFKKKFSNDLSYLFHGINDVAEKHPWNLYTKLYNKYKRKLCINDLEKKFDKVYKIIRKKRLFWIKNKETVDLAKELHSFSRFLDDLSKGKNKL